MKTFVKKSIASSTQVFPLQLHQVSAYETSATAIGWALFCFATHEEVQEHIAEELHSIFGELETSNFTHLGESERDVRLCDLRRMRYLEMCVKEALRVRPPVPFVMRQLKHGDCRLGLEEKQLNMFREIRYPKRRLCGYFSSSGTSQRADLRAS